MKSQSQVPESSPCPCVSLTRCLSVVAGHTELLGQDMPPELLGDMLFQLPCSYFAAGAGAPAICLARGRAVACGMELGAACSGRASVLCLCTPPGLPSALRAHWEGALMPWGGHWGGGTVMVARLVSEGWEQQCTLSQAVECCGWTGLEGSEKIRNYSSL